MIVEHLGDEVVQINGVMATLWGHRNSVTVKHPLNIQQKIFRSPSGPEDDTILNGTRYDFYDLLAIHF